MVRWSVIAQCGRPDQAPEVSLLGLDDSTLISGYGDATLKSSQSNQRSHHQRLQKNSHQLIQERFWQQYVISEAFSMDCLTKWKPVKNANFFCLQYCILADQLYQSYARFQVRIFNIYYIFKCKSYLTVLLNELFFSCIN